MIAKGKSCNHVGNLADYLLKIGDNENVIFHGAKGTVENDLHGALNEIADIAKLTNCEDFLYHLSIRPRDGEHLTPEQWERTVSTFEKRLKLEDHQRAIVEHVKDGTSHFHVVWSRIDPETMRATNMGWNYAKHEEAARAIEKEFGLEQVPGRFARDPDQERPKYGPDHHEMTEAKKNGFSVSQWRAEVRAMMAEAKSGPELRAALDAKGYLVARGADVEYMLLDPSGNERRAAGSLGVRVKELREMFGQIKDTLPTVEQAKQLLRVKNERIETPAQEITKPRVMGEMEANFKKAYIASRDFETFKEDFARRGYTLHRADNQAPIVALDREGRIVPLDAGQLSRGCDPSFLKQIEAAKLSSVDQEMRSRERQKPQAIAPEKSVAERLQEMKEAPQKKSGLSLYASPGMVAQQSSARRHIKLRAQLAEQQKKEAALAAQEKLALQRLEKVAAKQTTAAPKTPEQIAAAEAMVAAYQAGIRAERDQQQAEKRAAEMKTTQEKAAREVVTREKAAQPEKAAQKTTRQKPDQEKATAQQEAAKQTTQRRAEEQREQVKAAAPPRQTQAQQMAQHKAATTEQKDGQKRGILETWSVPTKSGRENSYDYDRER